MQQTGRGSGSGRIAGIDLARFLAIAGMLAVHIGPTGLEDAAGRIYAGLSHGRASILFGLLAGVGVSLLAAGRGASPAGTRLRLAWHAALLLPLGLWLQGLDSGLRVILAHYALFFVLGAATFGLATRWLAALAGLAFLVGPLVFFLGRAIAPATFNRSAPSWGDPMTEIAHDLVLSGPYPAITWAAPFLVGMIVGRQDLRAPALRRALVLGGGLLAVASLAGAAGLARLAGAPEAPGDWRHLLDAGPHSQMPPWLFGATGSALAVLGAALVAADRLGRLAWPLVATGQLALSVYVGHVLAFHWFGAALRAPDVGGALILLVAVLGAAILAAVLWRAVLPRGPLEALLALPRHFGAPAETGPSKAPDAARERRRRAIG